MTWNYRVVKADYNGTVEFSIREVYYNENGEPDGVTEDPSWPAGETWEEFQADLNSYNMAMLQPVLDYDMFLKQETSSASSN